MPLTQSELEPLLRLALTNGVGPHRLGRLVERFHSAARVLAASERELRSVPGIGGELARRIRDATGTDARQRTHAAIERLDRLEARCLLPTDAQYPASFDALAEPPYLLFAIGNLDLLRLPSIAIVGTRSPTAYGLQAARQLSRDLSAAGFGIVSGLARGIDSAAHRGALEGNGATVAVLGHGIEQVYPPENRALFKTVRERGLLISEYPPGETPKAGNFPRRNRLITALADAVLVVEMRHRSGAQHTIVYALDQGKEVMAVPGPIGSPASEGTNQLIKDGARMVTCAADVLEELRGVGAATPSGRPIPEIARDDGDARTRPEPALSLLTAPERRILAVLSPFPSHVDELAVGSGLPASAVLTTLLGLELRGLVASLPGKRYLLRPGG